MDEEKLIEELNGKLCLFCPYVKEEIDIEVDSICKVNHCNEALQYYLEVNNNN